MISKVEYDGEEYYAEQSESMLSCEGCAFNKPDVGGYMFCSCEDSVMANDCYEQQSVWKKTSGTMLEKESKFTVEQVILAVGKYLQYAPVFEDYDKVFPEALNAIKQDLMQQSDPEYKLFLELKAKYES